MDWKQPPGRKGNSSKFCFIREGGKNGADLKYCLAPWSELNKTNSFIGESPLNYRKEDLSLVMPCFHLFKLKARCVNPIFL